MNAGLKRLDDSLRQIAGTGLDQQRRCQLVAGEDVGLSLTAEHSGRSFYVAADLCRVEQAGPDFFRRLAVFNARPGLGGGMSVGLNESASMLVAIGRWASEHMDTASLHALLEEAVQRVRVLRRQLMEMLDSQAEAVQQSMPMGRAKA